MSETIIVFKATRKRGLPTHGTTPLPKPHGKTPGAWHDTGRDPVLCRHGVHGCRTALALLRGGWLNEWLWVAELRGPFVEDNDKIAGRSGRLLYRLKTWNEQTARLFAADCAESVAQLHPIVAPTVLIARRFAFGLAGQEELAAAGYAAWNATGAAQAAVNAAGNAARYAAWAAVEAAEYEKQALRLHDYLSGKVDLEAIRRSVS